MSLLEPEEMRYASISAFGLIVFTTILKWSGVGNTRYTPVKPSTANATKAGNRTVLDSVMDPSLTGGSTGIDYVIDIVLTPIQIVIDQLLMWSNVWDVMGFGSIFIIVPMMIMLAIIGGVIIKLLSTVLP